MIGNQEEDEFVAVRVQDPRIQNEGSWNSYVDYKIFLHTNSKAFTAKTSCVRRRYSEFFWLKKKLQKNAGLVPVPDLPGKSFFSFSNEDFLEQRRKGLQAFLDKVVNMTVCLSDSQLHLFLQTQLPVGHIQDCVQGHTPYSVTDAILTYASSNRGFAQAQEDDSIKEPSLTVSYESMESPAPRQPCPQTKEPFSPELFSCSDADPLDGLLEPCGNDTVALHKEKSLIRVLQKNNLLEAVVEDRGPAQARFFLGGSQDDLQSLSLAEESERRSCQIQTPVEVHSPMGTGFEEESSVFREESVVTLEAAGKTVAHPDTEEKADQGESCREANIEKVDSEPELCVTSVAVLDIKDCDTRSQEDVQGDVCSEKQVSENHVFSEVNGLEHVGGTDGHVKDLSCPEELKHPEGQKEPDNEKTDTSEEQEEEEEEEEEMLVESETHEETPNDHSVPEVGRDGYDTVQQVGQKQVEQEVDLVGTQDERDEDSHSLPSSNESIVKVSDEESLCDEAEDSIRAANGYMKTSPGGVTHWSGVEAPSRNVLDIHINGCAVEEEDISTQEEDEQLQYISDSGGLSKSVDLNSAGAAGDDFSILETSRTPGAADGTWSERETPSVLSLDTLEETREVEVN